MTSVVWFVQCFRSERLALVLRHCSGAHKQWHTPWHHDTQSNLGTSLRSYITGHFRIKTVLKFKRPVWFGLYRAFGPNACLATVLDTMELHTQSNLETSLCSYVTAHFRIKTVLKRPVRFSLYRAFSPNAHSTEMTSVVWFVQGFWSKCLALALCARALPWFRIPQKYTHNWSNLETSTPCTIATSLVVSGSNLETSHRSYVTGHFRIN